MEGREVRRTKGCRVGWAEAGPRGNGVGAGWAGRCPHCPEDHPSLPPVLARKPIGYLSHHPRLWAAGRRSGPGSRTPSRSAEFPRFGAVPKEGLLVFPAMEGIPSPGPRPLGREGILGEEGSRGADPALSPHRHTQSESHACPCIGTMYRRAGEAPSTSLGKKKEN